MEMANWESKWTWFPCNVNMLEEMVKPRLIESCKSCRDKGERFRVQLRSFSEGGRKLFTCLVSIKSTIRIS